MFDIAFSELALTGLVALVVLGPDKLPGAARKAGLYLGKARRMMAAVKAEVERELRVDELRQNILKQNELDALNKLAQDTKADLRDIQTGLHNAAHGQSDVTGENRQAAAEPAPADTESLPTTPTPDASQAKAETKTAS